MQNKNGDILAKFRTFHQMRCPSVTILIFPPRYFFFRSHSKLFFVCRFTENRLLKKFVLMAILWLKCFTTYWRFIHDHGWMNKKSTHRIEGRVKSTLIQSSNGTFAKNATTGRCKNGQIIDEADKGVCRAFTLHWISTSVLWLAPLIDLSTVLHTRRLASRFEYSIRCLGANVAPNQTDNK